MSEFPEDTQAWRVAPPKGAYDSNKPYLTPPGYLRSAENVVLDRRTMRRRPFRRKLNHTAAGVSGIRLRREAVIPWSRHVSLHDVDFTPAAHDFCLEFWFRNPTDLGFPDDGGDHRVAVAFQGSRANHAAGYGGGPGYVKTRTIDGPFTLNLARLAGDWFWELYGTPGTSRVAVKAAPFIRQHVSVVVDAVAGTMELRNSNDGDGNEVTASMPAGVSNSRQHWRFRGPAEAADVPEDPPFFELECIRMWHSTRTAQQIQDNRDFALPGDTAGLVGQWTGDKGTRDHLLNEASVELPMFFTADYPSYYSGPYGSGAEIASSDTIFQARYLLQFNDQTLLDEYTAPLVATYDSLRGSSGGGAFHNTGSGTKYATQIRVKMLETNLHDFSTTERRGFNSGQFEIWVDSNTGIVSAVDNSQPAVYVTSGAVAIGPGERHVIAVERDTVNLNLYLDGVLVGNNALLNNSTGLTLGNRYGMSLDTNAIAGSIIIEEIAQWYGKPLDALSQNLLTLYPDMNYPDSIDKRISGSMIKGFVSVQVTNGSTAANSSGATLALAVGDFLVDTNYIGRRSAYRVAVAGVPITLATPYLGQSGSVTFAVTTCLFYCRFNKPWSTESNRAGTKNIAGRIGNQNLLPMLLTTR